MLRGVNITYLNETVDVESLVKPVDTTVLYEGGLIMKTLFIDEQTVVVAIAIIVFVIIYHYFVDSQQLIS